MRAPLSSECAISIDVPGVEGGDFARSRPEQGGLMKPWLLPPAVLALAVSASAADWSPDLVLRVKRVQSVQSSPDGSRVVYVVGTAVTEGEKSEWLSHVW